MRYRMWVVFVQSLLATLGSLYYQYFGDPVTNLMMLDLFPAESGFVPCELCWYARILMYPIVVISGVALYRRRYDAVYTILCLALPGIALETYHYILQKTPQISTGFACTAANPCDALYINYFGFLTIPLLCWIAFCVIAYACYRLLRTAKKQQSMHLL